MKELIIIGARGFGRETYNLAINCKEYNVEWTVKGFLDDKENALDGFDGYPPIIGPVETYEPKANDVFICALGEIIYKKKYTSIILEKGGNFINLIHPTTNIHMNVTIGKGVIINAFCFISNDIKIGNYVTVLSHAALGHDVKVGDWCQINAYAFLGGYVDIKDSATIYAGSKIVDRVTIGENAIIGIGSVVIKSVKAGTTVFGNPARVI